MYLLNLIKEMEKQQQEIEAKTRRHLTVPNYVTNEDEENDENFDVTVLEGGQVKDIVAAQEMTQLIIEKLLSSANYPKKKRRNRSLSFAGDQNNPENDLQDRAATTVPELLSEAAGGGAATFSLLEIDNPDYEPKLYESEAISLLTNEFRWLFIKAIKDAFKMNDNKCVLSFY